MSRTNKYGRTDYIPASLKREIRKNCGFGCVNCGSPFYDYEHWNPPFEELDEEPSVDGITLCCPNCHRMKGKLRSMEEYENNILSPASLRNGYVKTDWGKGFSPEIVLGNVVCTGGTRILELDDELMIGFHPPEEPGTPPRLVARFFGRDGEESFRIIDNECIGNPEAWDIESTGINSGGWKWLVRNNLRKIDLHLELYPPHQIVIKKMFWRCGPLVVLVSDEGLQLVLQVKESEYKNQLLLKDMKVQALGEDHSFLKINREMKKVSDTEVTLFHHIISKHMHFDGGGIGKFSNDPNEPLIVPKQQLEEHSEDFTFEIDTRPVAFKFPVFLFVKAEPETPAHDVEVATISALNNLLPAFDNETAVNSAQDLLVGEYNPVKFYKAEFIKFLKQVVIPKSITSITFNPVLSSPKLRQIPTYSISHLITCLESEYSDEEIEDMIENQTIKKA